MRTFAVLICALACGCASRPEVNLRDDIITQETAFDLRVQITQASDLGAAGVTLGGLATDAEYGDPIVGLNVIVDEDPRRGAATGLDGRFVLDSLRTDQTLRFHFIGYRTLRARVSDLIERRGATTAQER